MMLCLKLTLLTLLIAAPGLHVSGETVITCDGDVQRLSCDTGVILVTTTVYGRSDSKICSNAPRNLKVTDTSCSSTVSTIADRCNGLRECEVKTNLLGSSNPCKGTYKYYTTTYDCINARDVVVCEHGYRTLDCGADTINIMNANFGRADTVTCSSGVKDDSTHKTNCYAPNTFSTVTSLCNGQHKCTVESSSSVFKDSCKETAKYLTVSYTCLKTLVTCEQNTAGLTCGNLKIKISSASFGRTNSTTCSSGRPAIQLSNTMCYASNALKIVNDRCNRQSSCQVPASNYVFSDPCGGTYKYLTIVYSCI
ncbi:rhamnose-binding lectin-like [Tachysurus vachellii]|uniref:rhamnose-binding lectin-like n=1 Tax=Tachysurus vachellii TaxID=175792 RepID=UPI00296B0E21|nr:rhamnose-binding lectin-like [Tachysurus vachellii]